MVLVSRQLSLNGIGWKTRAKFVIFIGRFRSFYDQQGPSVRSPFVSFVLVLDKKPDNIMSFQCEAFPVILLSAGSGFLTNQVNARARGETKSYVIC